MVDTSLILQDIRAHLQEIVVRNGRCERALIVACAGLEQIESLADADADHRSVVVRDTYRAIERALRGEEPS
jgi:hypothetical protein